MSKNKKINPSSANNKKNPSVTTDPKPANNKGILSLMENLTMFEKFSTFFIISMFTVFPIFMTDKLFNIRKDRLHYFMFTTFALLFFIAATYVCGIDKNAWSKKIFKISVADIGMLSFVVVCALSSAFSIYGMESVTGSGGRDSGLILMAVYVLCYLLISRYYKCKPFVFNIFTVAACLISLLAVLNEFYVDPFGIFTLIKEEQQATFITTIGNINLYSCFMCVTIPVMFTMLIAETDTALTVFYSIACGIGFMGLLVANSDSGYFGIGVLILLALIYACGNARRMFGYSLGLFSMLISCKVLRLISSIFGDKMKELDTIPKTLIFDNKVYILIAAAGAVTIIFYLLSKKFGDKHTPKWVRISVIALVVLCALSILVPFIYFSFIDTTTDLGSLTKYLRLNDQWGTHRGYAWIRSIILFKSNGIKNILIGSGPDTFGQMMKAVYRDDMIARHGSVFDSAHNEYLNYLVTIGILGLAAYLLTIAAIIVRGIKHCKNSLPMLVIILVIASYCAQALFNLAQPITTPYLFLFLAMGEAVIRQYELEQKK